MGERTLILVRHGQYHLDREHERHGRLTALGIRQAKRLARRLVGYSLDALHTSTAPRAIDTAALIRELMPELAEKRTPLLVEGIPTLFKGIPTAHRKQVPRDRARMDRAFARYFRPTRGRARIELLVCHGNIIRYLLRRALNDSPHKWWHSSVMHCGVCIVTVRDDGQTRVLALNDVGHLPRSMQTLS
jgi:serine/threonine-protein phosphatase PGAM5